MVSGGGVGEVVDCHRNDVNLFTLLFVTGDEVPEELCHFFCGEAVGFSNCVAFGSFG